ncbi:MAG TPA: hypothetical protein VFV26_05680, partial [Geothrix sp.]|nr:hypothetical protein [Geothrix sp.]
MRLRSWRCLTALWALLLLAACGGGGSSSSSYDARITLQAQFEKRILGTSGFGGTALRPARYCWAEVRDASSDALLASGYLGSDGTGMTTVPRGASIYVRVYAQYQVPSADPGDFFMRGSVKNAPLPGTADLATFTAIPDWSVTSGTFLADQDGTLAVTALASNRIAGAFNIADQAVTFGAAVRDMGASTTLRLPNLHTFWNTSTSPANQDRTYPALAYTSGGAYLVTASQRAIFSHSVYGLGSGAANTETDEWDDGVLQETFARLLFADGSYRADGSSALSLLRRDNDNVWVDRGVQSEPAAAFVAGFSDFLAAAILNDNRLLDSYVDGGGVARVAVFDLADHTYVPNIAKGEFARGSVAASLWGIWQNAAIFSGTQANLQTMWRAADPAFTPNPYEFGNTPLACYPTYLTGLKRLAGVTAATSLANELYLEKVGNGTDPTSSAYLNGPALWTVSPLPINASGGFSTDGPAQGYFYDRDTASAFRFVQGSTGPRTLTLNTSGPDL